MTDSEDWEIPRPVRPKPEEVGFDLDEALAAVVSVQTQVADDAFTAGVLGTERAGNGVLIDQSGLVITIGYLITEAETVWLGTNDGAAVPAHVVGYDHASGLGLVQALGRIGVPPMALGRAEDAGVGEAAIIAGHGGRRHALKCKVMAKHEFAGYWEYVLDEAIFTAPPHPSWGGAGLIGGDGTLLGIGSLSIQSARSGGGTFEGNMVVPADLLPPILEDLLRYGKVDKPAQPWLGMYTADAEEGLVVLGLATGGPAHGADIRIGDQVAAVAGQEVTELVGLFRSIWALGPAGVEVPLTIVRQGERREVRMRSADRTSFLKSPRLH